MNNKEKFLDFLESTTKSKILLITGESNSGKTFLMNKISEYLKYFSEKEIHTINTENHFSPIINKINVYDINFSETIIEKLKTLKNSIIIIDNISSIIFTRYSNNLTFNKILLLKKFIQTLREISIDNNLQLIIVKQNYNFLNFNNYNTETTVQSADIVCLTYKEDNILKMKILKSRYGCNYNGSYDINLSPLIRKRKIENLLKTNP